MAIRPSSYWPKWLSNQMAIRHHDVLFPFIGRAGIGKLRKTMLNYATVDKTTTSSQKKANILSEDVKEVLEKYQMAYTRSTYIESMNITPCFTQPESEETGILFDCLTFLLHFKESVHDEILKEAMDFIKKNSYVQQNDKEGKRYYMDLLNDGYLISK